MAHGAACPGARGRRAARRLQVRKRGATGHHRRPTATTVAATTTTLAWDSAEAIQRVATYCWAAVGDLSPVTSTPDGASYAPSALNGVAVATVDAEGHIPCQGFGNR